MAKCHWTNFGRRTDNKKYKKINGGLFNHSSIIVLAVLIGLIFFNDI